MHTFRKLPMKRARRVVMIRRSKGERAICMGVVWGESGGFGEGGNFVEVELKERL